MTQHQKILNYIGLIRESHSSMVNIFTKGSCFNFYLILKQMYPQAIPYYNMDHVITNIDGKYYDITGEVKNISGYYKGLTNHFIKRKQSQIIKQLLKYEYKNES